MKVPQDTIVCGEDGLLGENGTCNILAEFVCIILWCLMAQATIEKCETFFV